MIANMGKKTQFCMFPKCGAPILAIDGIPLCAKHRQKATEQMARLRPDIDKKGKLELRGEAEVSK